MVQQQYTVKIQNNSTMTCGFYLYQRIPFKNLQEWCPLAWFSKVSHPGTQIIFHWQDNHCFAWCEIKSLMPGSQYDAWSVLAADSSDKNQNSVVFSKMNGAFLFIPAKQTAPIGMLQIETDDTIPIDKAAVGLGMDGQPTLIMQASPNYVYSFTADVEYWIGYGNYTQGMVIQPKASDFQIRFPYNINSVLITLQQDNTWSLVTLAKNGIDETIHVPL